MRSTVHSEKTAKRSGFLNHSGFLIPVRTLFLARSVWTKIVWDVSELQEAINEASRYGDVLIEEYLPGKEATVCVVDGSEEGASLVFHPIEIVPPESNGFFDYEAKYSGISKEICPGRFTHDEHDQLRDLALSAHRAIGARHYSRSDFIVSPRGIALLWINTFPRLTEESLFPKALHAGGVTLPEFIDHVIALAL